MKKIWTKIKWWFWWNFRATEEEKVTLDWFFKGTSIMKNGKRVDPKKFFVDPSNKGGE